MNDIVLASLSGKPTRKEHSFPAVYVLTHQKTGMAYVGSTHNLYTRVNQHKNRLKDGTHRNSNLQRAYDDDPRFDLGFIKAASKEEALDLEQYLLDNGHSQGRLFNVATDARRAGLGVPVPEEAKKKLSEATRRQFADEAARQAQSDRSKELWKDPEFRAKHVGRERSVEAKQSVSEGLRQKYIDDPDLKRRQAESRKKEIIYEGVRYPSLVDASRILGIPTTTLHGRINRSKTSATKLP